MGPVIPVRSPSIGDNLCSLTGEIRSQFHEGDFVGREKAQRSKKGIAKKIRDNARQTGFSVRNARTFFMTVVIDSISRSLSESLLKSA